MPASQIYDASQLASAYVKQVTIPFPHAGHTHAVIDQRFSRISQLLRALDCFVPSGLGKLLHNLFAATEPKRHYTYIPGFPGIDDEETKDGPNLGPGDFKSAFHSHVHRFEGLGTESTGRRQVAYCPTLVDDIVIGLSRLSISSAFLR
jgi:hypothetical protein